MTPPNFSQYTNVYELNEVDIPLGGKLVIYSKRDLSNIQLSYLNDYHTIHFHETQIGKGSRWKNKYTLKELSGKHGSSIGMDSTKVRTESMLLVVLNFDKKCSTSNCDNSVGFVLHERYSLPFHINNANTKDEKWIPTCFDCQERFWRRSNHDLNQEDVSVSPDDPASKLTSLIARRPFRKSLSMLAYAELVIHYSFDEHEEAIQNYRKVQIKLMNITDATKEKELRNVYNDIVEELSIKIEWHQDITNILFES